MDNSNFLGSNELLANKQGNAISYAVAVGSASFQVDAVGDAAAGDKDLDSAQFGATLNIGDNGKVGIAYIDHPVKGMKNMPGTGGMDHINDHKTSMIAGKYNIGGMGLHLGYGQSKWDTDSVAGAWDPNRKVTNEFDGTESTVPNYDNGLMGGALLEKQKKTTFFGASGGLGDTGVSFFLQVRSNKVTKKTVTASYVDHHTAFGKLNDSGIPNSPFTDAKLVSLQTKYIEDNGLDEMDGVVTLKPTGTTPGTLRAIAAAGEAQTNDRKRGMSTSSDKTTPWVVGLSRSLGGGASVHLEHANTDDDSENTTTVRLMVNF